MMGFVVRCYGVGEGWVNESIEEVISHGRRYQMVVECVSGMRENALACD